MMVVKKPSQPKEAQSLPTSVQTFGRHVGRNGKAQAQRWCNTRIFHCRRQARLTGSTGKVRIRRVEEEFVALVGPG